MKSNPAVSVIKQPCSICGTLDRSSFWLCASCEQTQFCNSCMRSQEAICPVCSPESAHNAENSHNADFDIKAKLHQLCREAIFDLYRQFQARACVIGVDDDWAQDEIDRLKGKLMLLSDLGVIPVKWSLIVKALFRAAEQKADSPEEQRQLRQSRAWLSAEMKLDLH